MNVLLISIETTRADHLSCYGYHRKTSPFIDSLAEDGVLFENMYTVRGWTWPSLTSMLTSLYPISHNVRRNGHILDEDVPTLSQIFGSQGYQSAAFLSNYCKAGDYHFDEKECGKDPKITDAAIDWIGENSDEPFFVWMHYFAPHKSYKPPKKYDVFTDPDYDPKYSGNKKVLNKVTLRHEDLAQKDLDHIVGLYDGEILYADSLIEKVYAKLEEEEIANETIVVITADHGEDLYQHNKYFYHQCSIYESSLHIPFILKFPDGARNGTRVKTITENIDIAPTLMELTGMQAPDYFQGRSLKHLIEGEEDAQELSVALAEHDDGLLTIRTPRWRYIYNPDKVATKCNPKGDYYVVEEAELYDHEVDPLEWENVVETYPEISDSLKKELLQKYPLDEGKEAVLADEETLDELRALGYLI